MKWFDRKFSFEHLKGTFPSILERLTDTPLRLRNKIHGISQDNYTRRVSDAWTIQEQVGHLCDLESLWESRFVDFIEGRDILTPADLTNEKTHTANHNNHDMALLLDSFENQRASLCNRMILLSRDAESLFSKHPRLGTPMRPIDLAFFIAEHDDHHLASITEINLLLSKTVK